MTNEQKVEILEREIKRLLEENNSLKEQNEKLNQKMEEETYRLVQRCSKNHETILKKLKKEEKKYNKINRSLLNIKNKYLLEMGAFMVRNKNRV